MPAVDNNLTAIFLAFLLFFLAAMHKTRVGCMVVKIVSVYSIFGEWKGRNVTEKKWKDLSPPEMNQMQLTQNLDFSSSRAANVGRVIIVDDCLQHCKARQSNPGSTQRRRMSDFLFGLMVVGGAAKTQHSRTTHSPWPLFVRLVRLGHVEHHQAARAALTDSESTLQPNYWQAFCLLLATRLSQ